MTKGQLRELELLSQGPQPAYRGHRNRARAGVQNRLVLDLRYARYLPRATDAETVEITAAGREALAQTKVPSAVDLLNAYVDADVARVRAKRGRN